MPIGNGRHTRDMSPAEFDRAVRELDRPQPKIAGKPKSAREMDDAEYAAALHHINATGRVPCEPKGEKK